MVVFWPQLGHGKVPSDLGGIPQVISMAGAGHLPYLRASRSSVFWKASSFYLSFHQKICSARTLSKLHFLAALPPFLSVC